MRFLKNQNNSILDNEKMSPYVFMLCGVERNDVSSSQLIDAVRDSVVEITQIPWGHITVQTRKREITQARQMTHYFLRKYTKMSLSVVGKFAGGKDHATVMHSVRVVNNLMSTEKDYKKITELIDLEIRKRIDNIGSQFIHGTNADTVADWESVKNKYL